MIAPPLTKDLMVLSLNPALDPGALAASYQQKRRLQIRDAFTEDSAERTLQVLQSLPWGIAFNQGQQVTELDAEALSRLTPEDRRRIWASVHEGARQGYQFIYAYYPLFARYFTPGHPRIPLFDIYEFINSGPFIDLIRTITGHRNIVWADAQATCFEAGQFLKYHTDENPREQRVAAYVLNLTKGWGRDWGGYLQFFNERFDVEEAYRPIFNAINIFTVPMDHSVSMVSTYAPGRRLSVTGWFRADQPPGPFPR